MTTATYGVRVPRDAADAEVYESFISERIAWWQERGLTVALGHTPDAGRYPLSVRPGPEPDADTSVWDEWRVAGVSGWAWIETRERWIDGEERPRVAVAWQLDAQARIPTQTGDSFTRPLLDRELDREPVILPAITSASTGADELRARRKALGLSQVALAERLGVTATTVARWERGEMAPAWSMLWLALDTVERH